MKTFVYSLIIILGLISCNQSYIDKPKDLLSKSEMVDILTDLYLNQQELNFTPIADYGVQVAQNALYIFKEHNTTHKAFEESYKYYYTKPSEYQQMLNKVRENLVNKLSEKERKSLEEIEAQQVHAE